MVIRKNSNGLSKSMGIEFDDLNSINNEPAIENERKPLPSIIKNEEEPLPSSYSHYQTRKLIKRNRGTTKQLSNLVYPGRTSPPDVIQSQYLTSQHGKEMGKLLKEIFEKQAINEDPNKACISSILVKHNSIAKQEINKFIQKRNEGWRKAGMTANEDPWYRAGKFLKDTYGIQQQTEETQPTTQNNRIPNRGRKM